MKPKMFPHLLLFLLLFSLLLPPAFPVKPAVAAAPLAEADALAETPTTLALSEVDTFDLTGPVVYWGSNAVCPPDDPNVAAAEAANRINAPEDPTLIRRIAARGSDTRTLFSKNDPRPVGVCNPYIIRSNVVADEEHLYWFDDSGVVRLPVTANPGDLPENILTLPPAGEHVELAVNKTHLYGILGGHVWWYEKATGNNANFYYSDNGPSDLSTDGEYVYHMEAGGAFYRINPADNSRKLIDSGVTAYFAEGPREVCLFLSCFIDRRIYYAKGRSIVMYNNNGDITHSSNFYQSLDATASIQRITSDGNRLFVFEERRTNCAGFGCTYHFMLLRVPVLFSVFGGYYGGPGEELYFWTDIFTPGQARDTELSTDGAFVFWKERFHLRRLPNDAAAIVRTNVRLTGFSITQGIQRADNSVTLIRGRRTFIRVFAASDGPVVPGVTATLRGIDDQGLILGTLQPINRAGKQLSMKPNPQRSVVDDAFLFELPVSWTNSGRPLTFEAHLNPFGVPLEPVNAPADNIQRFGPFTFSASPRLEVQFISWGYQLGTTWYRPSLSRDINPTLSWIRRAYPLASAPGGRSDPSPGFRPDIWKIDDSDLGSRVNRTDTECDDLVTRNPDGSIKTDNRSLCASRYTNRSMAALRTEYELPESLFFYGMISDAGGFFPRGQACCGTNVSTGPVGNPAKNTAYVWDTDTTYGDWYAGHEIGHTVGRGHPDKGNTTAHGCNPYDAGSATVSYPWDNALIGNDATTEGFNVVQEWGIAVEIGKAPPRVDTYVIYPGNEWHDMMSYCHNQWISDHTYQAIFDRLSAATVAAATQQARELIPGDWLNVYGSIAVDGSSAAIHRARHVDAVTEIPERVPGPYLIQLLDGAGAVLADYPFTPAEPTEELPDLHDFNQVVDFVAGAARLQIVRVADGVLLAEQLISANAPVMNSISLPDTSAAMTGTVTLTWDVSDPDGDALKFDLFYSSNGGESVLPVLLGISGNSAQIDTSQLSGGFGFFRLVANDGVNTAVIDSPGFEMMMKPPTPLILSPGDGQNFQWGQVVQLVGAMHDPQDGAMATTNLVWSNQRGPLGSGAELSLDNLPVGDNVITLTATNSAGLSASVSVTITVGDNLAVPGPLLAAGPSEFAWAFASEAGAAQTSTLSIANAGGGELTWSASSDAPWLTLSAITGTAPSEVTLRVSPAGLAAGSALTSTLTISSTLVSQPLEIPLSITVGRSFTAPIDEPATQPTPDATTEPTPIPTTEPGVTPTPGPGITPTPVPGVTPTPPAGESKTYLPLVTR